MEKKTHYEDKFKINRVLKKIRSYIFFKKYIRLTRTSGLTR